MVLYGEQGNVKSMLSNLFQYEMIKKGLSTIRDSQYNIYQVFLSVQNERPHIQKMELQKYKDADYLFLDEVGRLTNTDSSKNFFFDLINYRYSKSKQTIITTNLKDEIKDYLDKDRLTEFLFVKFSGDSRRGK